MPIIVERFFICNMTGRFGFAFSVFLCHAFLQSFDLTVCTILMVLYFKLKLE